KPDWTDFGTLWFQSISPRFSTVNSEYFEWPFPRVAMIRNRARADALVIRVHEEAKRLRETYGVEPLIYLVGHSNGGYLIDLVAEGLIAMGWKIQGLLFMAAAVRAKRTTQRLVEWMRQNKVEKAELVIAEKDRVIGFLKWDPVKVVAFPWGALGREGWRLSEIPLHLQNSFTSWTLPSRHSGFLKPDRRKETYETIIGPFVGVTPEELEAAA
ncbi:MAG: hypothetical protein AAF491_11895, partial [Verrucomicrobiota bacterium]